MSVRAALNAAYTTLARRADEQDRSIRMFGGKDEDGADLQATTRHDLDTSLGVAVSDDVDEVDDENVTTNVIELHAWVSSVNQRMR